MKTFYAYIKPIKDNIFMSIMPGVETVPFYTKGSTREEIIKSIQEFYKPIIIERIKNKNIEPKPLQENYNAVNEDIIAVPITIE